MKWKRFIPFIQRQWIWWCLVLMGCTSVDPLKARYEEHPEVRGNLNDLYGLKYVKTACHTSALQALEAAKSAAHFGLRSLLGNKKYTIDFQEIKRSESNGQTCVTVSAQAVPK